ncbi:PSD1 and planctomycete cytochrome C domain-containing protein [Rubripirellula reticaptiva]|uniref:Planctomycete cytochrome C n=1 Tax=Rubripirellula reticaptiva TaxID=2528013 RepID=A0A5C6FCZ6_9BACT|nr:PSD1 and planctomycete cytochrome C domain-containing protein [Rubripirellula reticaptiva]TWU57946.1 Planctomycete cytochrome C [Rubripirellula reticaptiva]
MQDRYPSSSPKMLVRIAITMMFIADSASVSLAAESFDFVADIYSVLHRSCFECHGEERQDAGLRLDQESSLMESGVLEADDPNNSELVRRIELPRNHDEVMPMIGDPLSKSEVRAIRKWIAAGAAWPDGFQPPPHWSYVAPTRPALPTVSDHHWPRTPVDHFVLARLDDRGRMPSEPANPAVLLRRVHLDLIGLPPSLDEVRAFEADPSNEHFSRVVDQLLTRTQFGEHWARPWLDLARYADSHGFQRDDLRDLWPYRDWVIRAINDDMPFDQFTIEQLAGDLLPDATESQKVATGFHRCSPTNVEAGALPEETRIEQVLDRVNTTATVWLGSTLECAQCHDHKFDPFTIKNYYQFAAFFNQTEIEADRSDPKTISSIRFLGPSMPIANTARDQKRRELELVKKPLVSERKALRSEYEVDLDDWAKRLANDFQQSPHLHVMKVTGFESEGTTDSHQVRDDGAVLLVGDDPPSSDRYVVSAKIDATDIRAIRLDVLTDPSLPGTGPGRGDPVRNNFVLNEFSASLVRSDGTKTPLSFVGARADHSQGSYDVGKAIDGIKKTGWAISPQFSRPHWALFTLEEPLNESGPIEIEFVLDQRFGNARTIGCLQLSAVSGNPDHDTVPDAIISLLNKPSPEWSVKNRNALIDFRSQSDVAMLQLDKKIAAIDRSLSKVAPDTTQVMSELDQPRPSYVFLRGDYRSPGESVQPDTPAFLHSIEESSASGGNRLALAKWLVDPSNPLVARVTVNRIWAELFGEGIVRTREDFGIKGDRPSHPKLLDWLAVEFVQHGWSMKQLIKTIVMSKTYQQTSATSPESLEWDDQNRWLARGPRVRLDAETIRDNALAISGLISLDSFGPPIRPYQPDGLWTKVGGVKYDYVVSPGNQKHRRGVYVVIKRGAPYPSFTNFDAGSRFACTVRRSRSNTPLQALTLLNDPVYVEAAKAIALRAATSAKRQSVESTIYEELRRCVAREPGADEVQALTSLWTDQSSDLEKHPDRAKQLAAGIRLDGLSEIEFASWFGVANVMLNLHETITKE